MMTVARYVLGMLPGLATTSSTRQLPVAEPIMRFLRTTHAACLPLGSARRDVVGLAIEMPSWRATHAAVTLLPPAMTQLGAAGVADAVSVRATVGGVTHADAAVEPGGLLAPAGHGIAAVAPVVATKLPAGAVLHAIWPGSS